MQSPSVRGVIAHSPRPTRAAALWLALALSPPGFVLFAGIELLWHVLS